MKLHELKVQEKDLPFLVLSSSSSFFSPSSSSSLSYVGWIPVWHDISRVAHFILTISINR